MNAGANAGQEASPENASTWQSTPGALLNSAPPVQAVAHWQRRDDGWVPGRSAEARTAAHPDDSAHHPALQYARHIARVGLLAAALGIGAAMARTPDIAWAEPADTESSTSESGQTTSPDPQSGPSNQRGTTASSPTSGTTSAPTGSPSTSVSSSGESQTSVSVSAPGSSSPSVVVRSSGGARTPRPGGIAGRQPATGPGRAPAQTPDESSALAAAPEQPGQLAASDQAPAAPARPHRHGSSQPAGPAGTPAAVGTVGPAAPSGGTALHQPSGALVGKPLADSAAAPAHTADSTRNRHTVESVGPMAAFTPHLTAAPPAGPITTVVSSLLAAVGITSSSGVSTGDLPVAPMPLVLGALQLIRREIAHTFLTEASGVAPSTVAPRSLVTSAAAATTMQPNTGASLVSPGVPQPGDVVTTVYGDVGEWMLKANGEISNWGEQTHDGKALLEPINVIVIDPTSTTREESIKKVNRAMSVAGFPARTPHSTGYQGIIDGNTYGQQPTGFLQAFSDDQSDHGRMFGPAPAAIGQGYVWTGAFSTESSTHGYVSFDLARDELASRLLATGAVTRLDDVDLGNAGIIGDHDGYAVVLQLNALPNTPPSATVIQNKPSTSTGKVTGKVTAVDPAKDKLTYAGMATDKGTVTVTSTGSFTYTPTVAARHAAAADNAAADQTDTFSITASDGFGGVVVVPVTVAVVPKNGAPSAKVAVKKADPVSGTVTGSIKVTDADGDVFTYSATNPASGSVTINSDGTFSYNPSVPAREQARATRAKDTDKFTVTVDDGHGGVKTVTVTTTIAPTDRAPVAGTLTIGAPATSNGAIKGSLTASDPDDDNFSFSGSTKTTKGNVSVSRNGTFIYTPTAAARRNAASDTANPDDKIDTFTITVTDEYGATATIPVSVSILPG